MKRSLFVCSAAFLAVAVSSGSAAATTADHLADGAAFYASLTPAPMMRLLKKLHIDQLPSLVDLRKRIGGIDFLDPAVIAPSGVDGEAPISVAVELLTKEGLTHIRVAAPLRDAGIFRLFVGGLGMSGKVAAVTPDSAEGKLGVVAQSPLPDNALAILRIDQQGNTAVVDVIDTWNDKPTTALATAKRWPLTVAQPFVTGAGARQLFAPDAPLVLYADARHFGEVLEGFNRAKTEDDVAAAPANERNKLRAQRAKELRGCLADWKRSPATFDDTALAITSQAQSARATLAWGRAAGPIALHFAPTSDTGVDTRALGQSMPLTVALNAASLAPFSGLPHDGIYATTDKLREFVNRCQDVSAVGVFFRGWPNLAASGASQLSSSSLQQQLGPLAPMLGLLGSLRSIVVGVADTKGSAAAVGISFTNGAQRALIEGLAALVGAKATERTLGTRHASVYSTDQSSSLGALAAALETRPDGALLVSVASSEAALMNLYRGANTSTPSPALLSAHFDKRFLAQVDVNQNADVAQLVARLTTLDAEIRSDDLFRLSVTAPFTP